MRCPLPFHFRRLCHAWSARTDMVRTPLSPRGLLALRDLGLLWVSLDLTFHPSVGFRRVRLSSSRRSGIAGLGACWHLGLCGIGAVWFWGILAASGRLAPADYRGEGGDRVSSGRLWSRKWLSGGRTWQSSPSGVRWDDANPFPVIWV